MTVQMALKGAPDRTFTDRHSAGVALAKAAKRLGLPTRPMVLGLPRGGVPVAFELARVLHAPLDVLVVRKIGLPGNPELAIGAIASGGIVIREPCLDELPGVPPFHFEELAQTQWRELVRRERTYRGTRELLDLAGGTVLIVDDGLATGATMIAALRAARRAGAQKVIAAAPVASEVAAARVDAEADETLFLRIPPYLSSIGEWYDDFRQIEDDEVCALLERASTP